MSFDLEEFDVPREHGVDISLAEGMAVSKYGAEIILDILKANGVCGTFFCTANFAMNAPDIMARIKSEGHEIACHGCDHWRPEPSDVSESKRIIEAIAGVECKGYRQPRMFPVSDEAIRGNGYLYNSSLNPAFIPGRYMHIFTPRTSFMREGVLQIPVSVTPWFRVPLFWLSLHNFPLHLYCRLARRVLRHDGCFVTYFHPWEFYELSAHPEYRIPFIIKKHSGEQLKSRLDGLIKYLKSIGESFGTFAPFAEAKFRELNTTEI